MVDLNSLLPVDSEWLNASPVSINDNGQIVCSAENKIDHINHLILLTPNLQ